MRNWNLALVLTLVAVAVPSSSRAQQVDRVFLAANGGYQASSLEFGDTGRKSVFAEDATWDVDYRLKSSTGFDVGGGMRAWRDLIVSVGFSRFAESAPAALTGQIPHPFFFNRPRAISGESAGLEHVEQAVHVSAAWLIPVNRRFQVAVFGGPSFFSVKRDLVADVQYSENYPFDEATYSGTTLRNVSGNRLGFNAGADLAYFFTSQIGVGTGIRFSRAQVDLESPASGGGNVAVDAGALQVVTGLRVRFTTARRAKPVTPGTKVVPPSVGAPRVQSPGQLPEIGVTTQAASLYLRPDTKLTPLVTLEPGTSLTILGQQGEWWNVEFRDRKVGRRVGYVQMKFVRIEK